LRFRCYRGRAIRAEICQADISSSKDRDRLVRFVRDTFGRIDLLVNNAGVAPDVRADILEASEASFDRLMNINVKGPYFLTQSVAKWMIEQRRDGKSSVTLAPKIITFLPSVLIQRRLIAAIIASPKQRFRC
jgi:NAD(P)-dependent dehydrogenase (short-subunit alcohol dehydrogenase family)